MTILIDNQHESSSGLCIIPPLDTVSKLARLDSADAVFTGLHETGEVEIGIEVKTISDLVSSARSGRLQDVQLPKMLLSFHSSWVIYYGIYRPQERGGGVLVYNEKRNRWVLLKIGNWRVPYTYLQSITVEISELGFNVFHVSTRVDVAEWIYRTYLWWQKSWNQHKFMQVFKQDPSLIRGLDDMGMREKAGVLRVARVAAGLKGINYTRGIAAAKRFRSIRAMINATEQDWRGVKGVGKGIAQGVCRAIRADIDD